MNLTQNDRLNQVTADTLVVGVDIGLQFTAQQIQSLLTREKWASPKPREIKASRGVRGEMKIVAPQVTSFEI